MLRISGAIPLLFDRKVIGYGVVLKVLAHIYIPIGFVFSGCYSPYVIHLILLLPTRELFFFLQSVHYFSCKSGEPMSFDRMHWLDFKIIFLQASHPIFMLFTQFLLYKQCLDWWVGDKDYAVVLQQVGLEVFHCLLNCISFLVNGKVVEL